MPIEILSFNNLKALAKDIRQSKAKCKRKSEEKIVSTPHGGLATGGTKKPANFSMRFQLHTVD